ncbi:MAG: hypothetical protein KKC77_19185, partial [Proteobacteria bacterium]|nr:hypothetical protein [Pseudomonadota bacterium]
WGGEIGGFDFGGGIGLDYGGVGIDYGTDYTSDSWNFPGIDKQVEIDAFVQGRGNALLGGWSGLAYDSFNRAVPEGYDFGVPEGPTSAGTGAGYDGNIGGRQSQELQPYMQTGAPWQSTDLSGLLSQQEGLAGLGNTFKDATLSPEEIADFDTQYQLELEALQDRFNIESGRAGATQFASQLDRGIYESTTGMNEVMLTQERFAELLNQAQSDLLYQKEQGKTDFLSAKQGLEMGKYSLVEGMNQQQIQTAMEAAMAMSNYFQTGRGITASGNLNNALIRQAYDQQAYNQRSQTGGLIQGIGTGLLKSGLVDIFG